MSRSFEGRALLPGDLEGEAVVTRSGFNTYASFFTSIHTQVEAAYCDDGGNHDLYGQILSGKVICLPQTTGSTSAGAVWQRLVHLGVAPKAMLFSRTIDPLAAGGLIVADLWAGQRIYVVDQLGDEFLATVRTGDRLEIRKDGTVTIHV